ncbi:MAG: hypothetical protein V1494_00715 [Candidatus Diapherotrites archaeon]
MFLAELVDVSGTVAGASSLAGDWKILLGGLVLIAIAIIVFFLLKKIVVNTILGLVFWAIVVYGIKIELPFISSLIVSLIFGPAGVGVMLLLKFLGVPI